MNHNDDGGCALAFVCTGCLVIGITVGIMAANATWQGVTIRRGHAEYSQTTGEWQWKEVPHDK